MFVQTTYASEHGTVVESQSNTSQNIAITQLQSASTMANKNRTNITLAFFWDYKVNYRKFRLNIPIRDVLCELAVNETNQDPNILAYTYINIARVNSWDPEHADDLLIINSGGYNALQAMSAVEHGALLAVGERFDKTAVFSAQIFSYYNIPFCGADEAGFSLSDKNRFTTFFRMTQGRGFGTNLVQLLKFWNVKRVAIVLGGEDVLTELQLALHEAGIEIVIILGISQGFVDSGDYSVYYKSLQDVDARYIVFLASRQLTYDFYYKARYPPFEDVTFWYTQSYDCVKLIMQGLHNFMRDNPQFTPEMLANGSLNRYLTPDKFANTGYEGVSYNPVTLDEYGDLNLPMLFFSMNYSFYWNGTLERDTALIVPLDPKGTAYESVGNLPVFFGGSTIPPPDGPVVEELTIE
ncbi:hypothetical protein HDU76_007920, partial [Blyttiomyces sp. JEL0837]